MTLLRSSALLPSLPGILPLTGYGLWALLGGGLALDVYLNGRGEVLVPLCLGMLCVAGGLLDSALNASGRRPWRVLAPPWGSRPTRESLLAMATFLPMLAVAGLARGDNDFWATRLAGAVLVACSLATLYVAAQRAPLRDHATPAAQLLAALFSGGLWLWLCVALQHPETIAEEPVAGLLPGPWHLWLLLAGLALCLLEFARHGARMRADTPSTAPPRRQTIAVVLLFAVACVLLAVAGLLREQWLPALLAALVCQAGLWLRQRTAGAPVFVPHA